MAKFNDCYQNLYESDIAILKDYGGLKQKLTLNKSLRKKGYELDQQRPERGTQNETKLDESISRTKSTIKELAYCNQWELFVTLTLSPKNYNRTDLKTFKKDLGQFIQDYNKKHKTRVKYLLIPELHKDGSWHMHGFFMGLPFEHWRRFELDEKLPNKMLDSMKQGRVFYDWTSYRNKFGWVSMEEVQNREAVSNYVTKYITKELSRSITELNANMYYCSKGLQRAVEIKRGTISADKAPLWDFTNDYCKVKWFPGNDVSTSYMFD